MFNRKTSYTLHKPAKPMSRLRHIWLRPLMSVGAIAVVFLSLQAYAPHVFAIDDAQRAVFDNGISLYNLKDCAGGGKAAAAAPAAATDVKGGEGGANEQPIHDYFKGKGFTAAQIAAIMGNMVGESGYRTDASDGKAIGIAQWQGGRRSNLEAFAQQQGKPVSDLGVQLDFFMKEITTDEKKSLEVLQKGGDVASLTIGFQEAFERCSACHGERRVAAAQDVFTKFGGEAGGGSGVIAGAEGGTAAPAAGGAAAAAGGDASGGCGGGDAPAAGGGNGDIVKTALALAWPPPPDNTRKESTPAYVTAIAQYNGGGDQTDCGRFVATVMKMSGVDKDYPQVGTSPNQKPYLESHPDKYQIIHPNSVADFVPGDIMIMFGHTEIFIGDQGGGLNTAGASLGGHTPQVNGPGDIAYQMKRDGFELARTKAGATAAVGTAITPAAPAAPAP